MSAGNGITPWTIVVNERIKKEALNSNLDAFNTAVFESCSEAEEWYGS
jgi:hypothetical protein